MSRGLKTPKAGTDLIVHLHEPFRARGGGWLSVAPSFLISPFPVEKAAFLGMPERWV